MSILHDAFKMTRSLLNDDDGLTWTDALLMPKVTQVWGELIAKMQLNGIPVVKNETLPIALNPNTTSLIAANLMPTDLERPIWMKEYGINETRDNAVPMTAVDFIPDIIQATTLQYWAWIGQDIQFLGATVARNVLLTYLKLLNAPTKVTDILPVIRSEIFIGPRIAALIHLGLKDTTAAQSENTMAEDNLSKIIRIQVKQLQNLPVRRKPFSYAIRRRQRMYI